MRSIRGSNLDVSLLLNLGHQPAASSRPENDIEAKLHLSVGSFNLQMANWLRRGLELSGKEQRACRGSGNRRAKTSLFYLKLHYTLFHILQLILLRKGAFCTCLYALPQG